MKKTAKLLILIVVLYLTVFLVINPKPCLEAAEKAIDLCLDTVIPSLFPFLVCSGMLSALGFSALCSRFLSSIMRPVFNLPGAGALSFFLGILCGYPIGAATTADLYSAGQCTKTEAERMLAFCNNSGPLFVIGVVGTGFLKSSASGSLLYLSHLVSALIVGVIFRFYKGADLSRRMLPPTAKTTKKAALLSIGGVIDNSVFSVLKICGFIIFFAVLTSTLPDNPFLFSVIEITGGLKALSQLDSAITLPLMSFFLALSGLSVMLQVQAITAPSGLSLKPYIFGKLLQGGLSFALTKVLLSIFPPSAKTFLPYTSDLAEKFDALSLAFSSVATVLIAALVLICMMLILSVEKSGFAARRKRR